MDFHIHANLVPAFVTLLALGGQVGLPILVLTCLRSKRLNRHSTFVNCCITSIIYSLAFCILIYTGQYRRVEPNHALCAAQASMVMAVLPMVSVAVLMFVLQTWATFQDPGSAIFVAFERPYMLFILLASPYVTFFGYLLGTILVATSRPEAVWNHNGLYCSFKNSIVASISCLIPLTATAALGAAIMVQWYRQWHGVKKIFPLAVKRAQALICFRVCLFNAYTWLSLAASIMSFRRTSRSSPISYLAEAGVPLVAFLVFGTQKDILQAWGIQKEDTSATYDQQQVTSIVSSASEEIGPSSV